MSAAETERKRDALATLRIPRRDEPRRPPFLKRMLKRAVGLALVAAIAIGGYSLARQSGWLGDVAELVPAAIRSLPMVRVGNVVVERGRSADAVVVATGYLESRRQAMIGARAAGRIEAIHVEEGTRVTSGEIIAVLEHKDMDAALAATRATHTRARAELDEQRVAIAQAKSVFDRAQELRRTDTITDAEFDQAKFAYEGAVARLASLAASVSLAQARVKEAEQFKENMIIRAPFDGTVISKDAEVGESILPGGMGEASGRGSVVTIADLDHLEVDCDVKEDYISRVTPDAPAEVAVDAVPDRRYEGRVRKIIPMGDRARATIKVKVEILNVDERLFPDMSSTVYFLSLDQQASTGDEERRVFCDSAAIQSTDSGDLVWLLDNDNRAQRVSISKGKQRDDRMEVIDGLSGDERVILNPPEGLTPGTLLRIRE